MWREKWRDSERETDAGLERDRDGEGERGGERTAVSFHRAALGCSAQS